MRCVALHGCTAVKAAFHDADTDILADFLANMSGVSARMSRGIYAYEETASVELKLYPLSHGATLLRAACSVNEPDKSRLYSLTVC